jgi:hypothetical protein
MQQQAKKQQAHILLVYNPVHKLAIQVLQAGAQRSFTNCSQIGGQNELHVSARAAF